jgi:hypothetical protein
MENFKEDVAKLKNLNEQIEKVLLEKKQVYSEIEIKVSELTDKIVALELQKKAVVAIIEKSVLAKFEETKDKNFYGGIGVKEYTNFTYEEKEALKWAKEKDMFLTLDKKSFESACKNLDLDFVTIDKKPKVTYPKIIKLNE